MNILREMNADTELLIAGLLHDVVEDAGVSVDEIRRLFGEDVAELVAGHSEDKTKQWKERKEEDIRATAEGSMRLKMLVMADKVSNLRALYFDFRNLGELVWERFKTPAKMQAWYYSQIIDALFELQYQENTKSVYWEMCGFYKDIFVTHHY